jgi:hypothetical protein
MAFVKNEPSARREEVTSDVTAILGRYLQRAL